MTREMAAIRAKSLKARTQDRQEAEEIERKIKTGELIPAKVQPVTRTFGLWRRAVK